MKIRFLIIIGIIALSSVAIFAIIDVYQGELKNTLPLPLAQEFLKMDCKEIEHMFPEFSNKESADAWNTRMHECLNVTESLNAEESKLRLTLLTGSSYVAGEKIKITGKVLDQKNRPVENYLYDVTVKIDNGQLLEVAQLKITESGEFSYEIIPHDELWRPGTYTVSAFYDNKIAKSHFEFVNEFYSDSAKWNSNTIQWVGTGFSANDMGVVEVIDYDMNINSDETNYFDVHVWSDFDLNGIDLTVTEIDVGAGIFQGTVFFGSNGESSGHRLRVAEGDRVWAEYDGNIVSTSIFYSAINAGVEMEDLEYMSCDNIIQRNSEGQYLSKENRDFAREKILDCSDIEEFFVVNASCDELYERYHNGQEYWFEMHKTMTEDALAKCSDTSLNNNENPELLEKILE